MCGERNWDNLNNNLKKKTFQNVLHVLISLSCMIPGPTWEKKNFSFREKGPQLTKMRSRAYNDNEGSMKKFWENLIIDMCGRARAESVMDLGMKYLYVYVVSSTSYAGNMSIISFKYWAIKFYCSRMLRRLEGNGSNTGADNKTSVIICLGIKMMKGGDGSSEFILWCCRIIWRWDR